MEEKSGCCVMRIAREMELAARAAMFYINRRTPALSILLLVFEIIFVVNFGLTPAKPSNEVVRPVTSPCRPPLRLLRVANVGWPQGDIRNLPR